ncbi:hypothetical protein BESB_077660 [Besnoitia besnoiti]|uniref:Uncharacterized protein n=1 Tax=Besnoitia besnoiti TaxID=94643 RepID=A0A2A9M6H3_BESBE|nr:hypothetical protein BESB_077660 [Besnoitia besnoiti]PFH33549.1 hypothetical protein BESB_077660 [Besnoitia besnoiti]
MSILPASKRARQARWVGCRAAPGERRGVTARLDRALTSGISLLSGGLGAFADGVAEGLAGLMDDEDGEPVAAAPGLPLSRCASVSPPPPPPSSEPLASPPPPVAAASSFLQALSGAASGAPLLASASVAAPPVSASAGGDGGAKDDVFLSYAKLSEGFAADDRRSKMRSVTVVDGPASAAPTEQTGEVSVTRSVAAQEPQGGERRRSLSMEGENGASATASTGQAGTDSRAHTAHRETLLPWEAEGAIGGGGRGKEGLDVRYEGAAQLTSQTESWKTEHSVDAMRLTSWRGFVGDEIQQNLR